MYVWFYDLYIYIYIHKYKVYVGYGGYGIDISLYVDRYDTYISIKYMLGYKKCVDTVYI